MGIDCIKIEGRTKSDFYAARTAQLYQQAIDDAVAGTPFDKILMDAGVLDEITATCLNIK